MEERVPIVNKRVLLERFPGKGGWTYVRIPEIPPNEKQPFGWQEVEGYIDDFELKQCKLMPMGNGHLFLPVKASIRKQIKKEAGEWVEVVLYTESHFPVKEDFMLCLEDDPEALSKFRSFSDDEQEKYLNWIYDARTENEIISRMGEALEKISRGEIVPNKKKGHR